MKKYILIIILALGVAFAQECKPLLDSLIPPSAKEMQTMEFTMNMQMNAEGMDISTEAYYLMDRPNRRIYSKTETMGMTMVMVLNNGKFDMKMQMPDGSTMAIPEVPGMETQLEKMFDQVFDQSELLQDYTIVSCDGHVDIAGLVSGEQITTIVKAPKVDPENGEDLEWKEQEIKVIVIDGQANKFAYLTDIENLGNVLIIMNKQETTPEGFPKKMSMTMYKATGDSYELFSTMDYEFSKINQPIDESLFSLE